MNKMVSRGRLSEIAGKKTLNMDKFVRFSQLHKLAKKQLQFLQKENPEALREIQGFVDGINFQVDQRLFLPIEFLLTGQKFSTYTVEDVLVLLEFQSLSLTYNFQFELQRTELAGIYGIDEALKIYCGSEEHMYDLTSILTDEDLKEAGLYKKLESVQKTFDFIAKSSVENLKWYMNQIEFMKAERGSNSWVVSGERSKSGKPLIANDPHLPQSLPSFWYQSEIITSESDFLIGVGPVGVPYVYSGRNQYAAWTVTLAY